MAIVVKVNGGLGNQMFQYALGRKLSLLHGVPLLLDLSFFDLAPGIHTARPFELGVFELTYDRAPEDLLYAFAKARTSRWQRVVGRTFPSLRSHPFYSERGFPFDPSVFAISDLTYIEGHWQSEQYFSDIESTIRNDFRFHAVPDPMNAAITERIGKSMAVSVHVRRGDYVAQAAASAFHGVCSEDYYARAMARMVALHPDASFFVFSDDQEWAKANLDRSHPIEFVEANPGERSFEDMRLMSLCKHHIIANSSFSWWGAWLNPDPGKHVIAPTGWFRDPAIDTKDLIPAAWERM